MKLCLSLLLALAFAACPHAVAQVNEKPLPIVAVRAFPELKFDLPLLLTHAGDGTNRAFVLAQKGVVHVFPNDQAASETKEFLNIGEKCVYIDSENEQGLLGIAFHPKFRENGQFFIYYSTADKRGSKIAPTVISRFRVSKDDPNRADPASEEELLRIEHPYWNHKGGTIVFGPDGYLYVGLGDGGLANDPHGNGQNLSTLLGSILRIDVDRKEGNAKAKEGKYAIPKDNPFVNQKSARPEIWAYGVRNIWRLAFDRQTGTLWAADVGQDLWEEIDIIKRGGNYGWNLREGKHKFGSKGAAPRKDLIEPIWEYNHSVGKSITGGSVYRGKKLPELAGAYLYADYVTGLVWALRYDEKRGQVTANQSIEAQPLPVMSFGEDEAGEIYFLVRSGDIYTFEKK